MLTDRDIRTGNEDGIYGRRKSDRHILLRNILNVIFMLGALTGVIVYYKWNVQVGTVVILVSMLFKIVECVLRLIK